MRDGKIRVAFIGAGHTGTPLIKQLLSCDFVQIAKVVDKFDDAPGIVLARENGIPTATDYAEVVSANGDLDIIIEVSGDGDVKPNLRKALQAKGNQHTIIMPELVAILMLSMAKGELVQGHLGLSQY